MNCLQYALSFWDKNNKYRIYYNGDHVINLTEPLGDYIPLEEYGIEHILNSFKDLYIIDIIRLKRYFKSAA